MKHILTTGFGFSAVFYLAANFSTAQTPPTLSTSRIVSYEAGERGANYKIWNKVSEGTDSKGRATLTTNLAYVELAAGLHYFDGSSNQWRETKEEFTVVPGWALARKGPHKVGLAYNLNGAGAVSVELPDGRSIRSSVLSLLYIDKSTGKSAQLAEVQDCQGVVLPPNQVIYTNAFAGLKADVRFTYTKSGIEQDVILRQRPPRPEDLGLNAATTRLAVLTEFIDPPLPVIREVSDATDASNVDEDVEFGSMKIGRGRAFNFSTNLIEQAKPQSITVTKKWFESAGRHFLLEQVPIPDVRTELDKLPTQAGISPKPLRTLRASLDIPKPPRALPSRKSMEIARAWEEPSGFVMDYVQLNPSLTNFTFQSNQTYYVSGRVDLYGTTTFEGGAVIKCAVAQSLFLVINNAAATFASTPFSPVVITSVDDDSIGEAISGSSGNPMPSGLTNNTLLTLVGMTNLDVHDLHISYAHSPTFIIGCGGKIANIQVTHAYYPLYFLGSSPQLRNVLLYDTHAVAFWLYSSTPTVEHLTADLGGSFGVNEYQSSLAITNSLIVGFPSLGTLPLTTNFVTIAATNPPVFEADGSATHYLATNSPYRDAGTTNISTNMLAELPYLTTYPPPDSFGDTNAPDLGFHYPQPLDRDADGMLDSWEMNYFGGLSQTAAGDFDNDGLTNLQEYQLGTNPTNTDTDGDGRIDQPFRVHILSPR